jgi:hypothetical protein
LTEQRKQVPPFILNLSSNSPTTLNLPSWLKLIVKGTMRWKLQCVLIQCYIVRCSFLQLAPSRKDKEGIAVKLLMFFSVSGSSLWDMHIFWDNMSSCYFPCPLSAPEMSQLFPCIKITVILSSSGLWSVNCGVLFLSSFVFSMYCVLLDSTTVDFTQLLIFSQAWII